MSITYRTIQGDDFDTVARKVYGSEVYASNLRHANPGTEEPLTSGTLLVTPQIPGTLQDAKTSVGEVEQDQITLLIEDIQFTQWTELILERHIDAFSTVSFMTPFDERSATARSTFQPLSFKSVTVFIGTDKLFDGYLVNVTPVLTESEKVVRVDCYSRAAALNDCDIPVGLLPAEFNNFDLQQISEAVLSPFGLSAIFNDAPGAVFDRVACDPDRSAFSFLSDLANQRGLVFSDDQDGNVVFSKPASSGVSSAVFEQGSPPLFGVAPQLNGQKYFSSVTGIQPVIVGDEGSRYTERNTKMLNAVRPFIYYAPDTQEADIPTAVRTKIGRMFGVSVLYDLKINTWRTADGELLAPGDFVTVSAPSAMIYDFYTFVIRSIKYTRTDSMKLSVLTVTVPQAFAGGVPEVLPWEE